MSDETLIRAMKALGDPTRMRIVRFLSASCCGTLAMDDDGGIYPGPSASEICCHVTGADKITSTVSHHLHELAAAGLILIERRGKRMICTLVPEAVQNLATQVTALLPETKPS